MTRGDFPVRWRSEGATNLERRLLEAAGREEPSRELLERMANGIGVAPPPAVAPGGPIGAGAAAPKAAASSGMVLPWLSGAFLAVVAAGVVWVAAGPSDTTTPPEPAVAPVVAPPPIVPSSVAAQAPAPAPISEGSPNADAKFPPRRSRPSTAAADLTDQIALVDGARSAVAAGSGERALAILREYQEKYPAGSFRPEATALRIEALVLLGRRTEARAAAERFVSQHRGSPLSDRVARVAGVSP